MASDLQTFRVFYVKAVKRKAWCDVEAHYYTVSDNGTLLFKLARSPNYPLSLHSFARGAWREVVMLGARP